MVVIVNYRTASLTEACLRSLKPELQDFPGTHVTVVDNASGDGPALKEFIRSQGWEEWVTLVVASQNGGFAAGNNLAIRAGLGADDPPRYFFLLNPDTEVRPGAVRYLLEFMEALS